MALNIAKPFVNVTDSNGLPYVGATLAVYLPGTTTLASIYSDEALTVPLTNPLAGVNASDAAGNFPRAYIAAGTYKLRAETSTGVLIWQHDNIDTGLPAATGALPISRGGTGATTAAGARTNLDVPSNSELADLADDISAISASLQNIVSAPQGYLTPTSGVPCITSDVVAATAVYYALDTGNLLPIYDGIQFNVTEFAELPLTLNSNHVSNGIYDIFGAKDNGEPLLVTGPVWNTVTAGSGSRGTGAGTTELTRTQGILTNRFAITGRNGATTYAIAANQGTYLGSILMDSVAGQATFHRSYGQARKWSIYNQYNQRPIVLRGGDPSSSWTYNSATPRASHGDATNTLTAFMGNADQQITVLHTQYLNPVGQTGRIGVGANSSTAYSGTVGQLDGSAGVTIQARYVASPFLGKNVYTAMEEGHGSALVAFLGAESRQMFATEWMG